MNLGAIHNLVRSQGGSQGTMTESQTAHSFLSLLSPLTFHQSNPSSTSEEAITSAPKQESLLLEKMEEALTSGKLTDKTVEELVNSENFLVDLSNLLDVPFEQIERSFNGLVEKLKQSLPKDVAKDLQEQTTYTSSDILPFIETLMISDESWTSMTKADVEIAFVFSKLWASLEWSNKDSSPYVSSKGQIPVEKVMKFLAFFENGSTKDSLIKSNGPLKDSIPSFQVSSTNLQAIHPRKFINEGMDGQKQLIPGLDTSKVDVNKVGGISFTVGNANQPQPSTYHLFTQATESPAGKEQLANELVSILKRSTMIQSQNGQKLLIKLYPEELGSLRVELFQKDGVLTARILASTGAAKELLDSQLQNLKHSLQQQNVQIEKLEVVQALSEQSKLNKEDQHQQSKQQQTEQQKKEQINESEESNGSFEEFLALEV
ncbi:flagellar hook-length control protein FliK [Bacillus coahuilensis]|uniref:flagellar hook-length control protein FliK n=1 Tax=Bacillus coahuilensis TaxID=408580 RepID=UPI0007511B3F|nr:flagellar hook-length control protein FliK [Bacillus coahuilensis]